MPKNEDIRDCSFLTGEKIKALNFISDNEKYTFRKYYRSGLRSHIFEVLLSADSQKELTGEIVDGIRVYPRANPIKMLRILRNQFNTVTDVLKEIKKYQLLLKWLGKDLIATSQEFIVDYNLSGKRQIVLCGLQEYIKGRILDPWRMFDADCLSDLLTFSGSTSFSETHRINQAKDSILDFTSRIKKMIVATGFIPDLAGNGNLIITPSGQIKLVDINNIVEIRMEKTIHIDDKGYPSCDVSVQVLSILEHIVLGNPIAKDDPLYRHFLAPDRKQKVKALEKNFYRRLNA